MSMSPNLMAYESEITAFEQAKQSPRGIRIEFDDLAAARYYANRLHYARKRDRMENTRLFGPQTPMHGRSEFDAIRVRLREDKIGHWWVYLEKNEEIPGNVEEL